MHVKDAVIAALKEMVLPELAVMKQEQAEIKSTLVLTNKRLDDVNTHLADQSRRIDAVREELTGRIDETNKRIDAVREELTGRIDAVREGLTGRIDAVREELTGRIDVLREELTGRIDDTNKRLDDTNRRIDTVWDEVSKEIKETNKRLDRLFEVIVRRDEHFQLSQRLDRLENEMAKLQGRIAA